MSFKHFKNLHKYGQSYPSSSLEVLDLTQGLCDGSILPLMCWVILRLDWAELQTFN